MTTQNTLKIDLSGAQRLAAAVLALGVAEALAGDPAAIYWLFTADCAFYANLAGYDETRPLVTVARRCEPGRRILHGRLNVANFAQAMAL
jgi:hypothetical protein